MSYKELEENHRLEVYPDNLYDGIYKDDVAKKQDAYEAMLKNMKSDIIRHVDNVDSIYYEYDSSYKCDFCGYVFEEHPETVPFDCCAKVIALNKSKEETAAKIKRLVEERVDDLVERLGLFICYGLKDSEFLKAQKEILDIWFEVSEEENG
jgi:hypothetical protein